MPDIFNEIFGSQKPMSPQAARQICEKSGHLYQVYGRMNPTKIACSRCKVTWAIGPRTEPTT